MGTPGYCWNGVLQQQGPDVPKCVNVGPQRPLLAAMLSMQASLTWTNCSPGYVEVCHCRPTRLTHTGMLS